MNKYQKEALEETGLFFLAISALTLIPLGTAALFYYLFEEAGILIAFGFLTLLTTLIFYKVSLYEAMERDSKRNKKKRKN